MHKKLYLCTKFFRLCNEADTEFQLIYRINPDVKSIFDFRYEDFELENYDPWPHIAAEVSV